MGNALVMSGHIRTFKDIVGEIKEFVEFNGLDVYLYIWDEDNAEDIKFVVDTLKPIKWLSEKNELYSDIFFDTEERIAKNNPKELITADNNFVLLSMHFARRKAFELIEKEYDNIIFSRFDTQVFKFKLDSILEKYTGVIITPTNEQYGMISDIFAIIPWKYAESYFLYNRIEDILSRRMDEETKKWLSVKFYWENGQRDIRLHDENRYCPHMMSMRNYFESDTPYIVLDLPVTLKR